MSYDSVARRLAEGGIVILDGGTGTELERRGVAMDPEAWCGPATLGNLGTLESIHRDYISAGADVITANTYASSRVMLEPAGFADRFEEINGAAVRAALQARAASGRDDVAVAGSLSHLMPMVGGTAATDTTRTADRAGMQAAFSELGRLLKDAGCDLILLEMMYHPDRMPTAFAAACSTGLPVWAGFSARRGESGEVLSFTSERDIPFAEVVQVLEDFEVAAAGIMHTPANAVGDSLAILREAFDGPLTAYPDSGYFKMPSWQFEKIIPPDALRAYADGWVAAGARVLGGCCGLSPEHIAALAPLKSAPGPRP